MSAAKTNDVPDTQQSACKRELGGVVTPQGEAKARGDLASSATARPIRPFGQRRQSDNCWIELTGSLAFTLVGKVGVLGLSLVTIWSPKKH